jgi:hypothetical protein
VTIFLLLVNLLLIRCKLSEYLLASTFTKSSHNRGQHGFSRRFIPAGVHYCSRTHSATTYRSGWLTRPKPDIQPVLGATEEPVHAAEYSAQVYNIHPGTVRPHPICIINIIIHGGPSHSCVSKWNARTKCGSSDKLQIRSRSRGVPYHLPDAVSALIMDQRTRPFS